MNFKRAKLKNSVINPNLTDLFDSKLMVSRFGYAYSVLRSANYTAQSVLLPLIDLAVTQKRRSSIKDFISHLKDTLPYVDEVLRQDADNISNGVYPLSVLKPKDLTQKVLNLPYLYKQAINFSLKRKNNIYKEFDKDGENFNSTVPEYYKRNFHFQESGYLSHDSSKIYEQQVEMLFSGTANAMRRSVIAELKKRLGTADGEGLRFLELGSGNGNLTEFMALAFPKAQITCVDLSPYYLKTAQKKLDQFARVDFVQANAESLPFSDEKFDLVFSVYLFHELPLPIRKNVIDESKRVLKSGGYLSISDSIQWDDNPHLNWALERFPLEFHEPFYTNYVKNPIEEMLKNSNFSEFKVGLAFLTKYVVAQKLDPILKNSAPSQK